jgi:hypothetical protein
VASIKKQLLVSVLCGLVVSAGAIPDLVTSAMACIGSSPYCASSSLVPCQAGTCVPFSTAFPGQSAPVCTGLPPATTVGYVSTTVSAAGWSNCGVANDDSWSCYEQLTTCATYVTYDTDDSGCANPCPDQFSKQYCAYWHGKFCPT